MRLCGPAAAVLEYTVYIPYRACIWSTAVRVIVARDLWVVVHEPHNALIPPSSNKRQCKELAERGQDGLHVRGPGVPVRGEADHALSARVLRRRGVCLTAWHSAMLHLQGFYWSFTG